MPGLLPDGNGRAAVYGHGGHAVLRRAVNQLVGIREVDEHIALHIHHAHHAQALEKNGHALGKHFILRFKRLFENNRANLAAGALISFAIAIVIGIIFGMFSVSPYKSLRVISEIFVDVIRGIPLMILAAFIFWGIPS